MQGAADSTEKRGCQRQLSQPTNGNVTRRGCAQVHVVGLEAGEWNSVQLRHQPVHVLPRQHFGKVAHSQGKGKEMAKRDSEIQGRS